YQVDSTSASRHLILGRLAMRQNRLEEARRQLAFVVKTGSLAEQGSAHNNLGIIAVREGRFDVGRDEFGTSRRLQPKDWKSYLYPAGFMDRLGTRDSAETFLLLGMAQAGERPKLVQALRALREGQAF